mmetsp:Transcript_33480/g.64901  ORF Transcript_33480/g.64901 Transcript_33480/m.64901 type:complete len:320 (-) Transcript_33480:123-1082(-)
MALQREDTGGWSWSSWVWNEEHGGGQSSCADLPPDMAVYGAPHGSEVISRNGHRVRPAVDTEKDHRPERVYRERVLVRVYDLGQTFMTRWHNELTRSYGAFHTGVEVYGREWSFGMTFDDYSTGVTWNAPKMNHDHSYRETLSMGYTSLSRKQVDKLVEEMKIKWKGCSYNMLSKNCHNFSDEFCFRLGVTRLPAWVNDLAYTGAEAVEFLDGADTGYDGGAGFFNLFSQAKTSLYNAFVGNVNTSSLPDSRRGDEDWRRGESSWDRPKDRQDRRLKEQARSWQRGRPEEGALRVRQGGVEFPARRQTAEFPAQRRAAC